MTETRTRRATLALAFVSCLPFVSFVPFVSSVRATAQGPSFRSRVDLVNLGVTVTDRRGSLVTDLTPDDLEIYEDGKKQTIRYFTAGAGPGPALHLGLMLDVSESMGEDMSFTKTASIKFLNTLTDAVDITVVDFDTEVRSARYGQNEFARLIERIRQKRAGGWTALYDAIGTYLDGAAGQTGRKIMLVYTDGGDTRSSIQWHELLDLLKASDVTVYAIGMLEHQLQSTKLQQRMTIQQLAEVTGAYAHFPIDPKKCREVMDKIAREVSEHYTIGYYPANQMRDGRWRKLKVTVAAQPNIKYVVHARSGYYAAGTDDGNRDLANDR